MKIKIKNMLLKRTLYIYLAVLYGILLQSCLTQETEEALAHTTELVFYSTSASGWSTNGNTEKLQTELVAQANTYCQTAPESCGLTAMNDGRFQNSDVVVIDGFPEDDTRNMKIKFYMKLPGNVTIAMESATQILLMKDAVNAISLGARDKVHEATGSYIIFIEETHYGPPPTTLANSIIIPLAFAVLFGVIIAAISLNFYVKHREKQEKHLKQIEMRRKKTPKVAPAYPNRNDNGTTSTILSNEQRDLGYHQELLDKNPNPPTEPYIAQPLERSDQQGTLVSDDEKKDRRRRHKKSRRHRHHDNGVENPVIEEGKTLDDLLQ